MQAKRDPSSRGATATSLFVLLLTPLLLAEKPPVVTVQPPPPLSLAAGGLARARIQVTVAEGFHVQANPASADYLVPTKLELSNGAAVSPGKPIYPKGKPWRLQGSKDELLTYGGTFEISVPLRAEAGAVPGEQVLKGKLDYQACDAKTCLFPASVPVEVKIAIGAAKAR